MTRTLVRPNIIKTEGKKTFSIIIYIYSREVGEYRKLVFLFD
jgi:hypothetical protein